MALAAPQPGRLVQLERPRWLLYDLPKAPFEARLRQLKNERSPILSEWQDISAHIQPRRGRYLGKQGQNEQDRSAPNIINPTGSKASRTLRNGMQSGASSPARPWFRLTTPDPSLAENGAVKEYLTTVARRMAMVFARSNIYDCLHAGYGDLGDFGTSVMVIDEDFDDVIRCHVYSPGEYLMATDGAGRVNTLYREFRVTARQALERWGKNCSFNIQQLYDSGSGEQYVEIVECIEPNVKQVNGQRGPASAPFLRVYYEPGQNEDKLLSVNPCWEFPACAPRWGVQSGDVYGYGPGLMALADVKGLQMLERRKAMMVDKMATPPTQSLGSAASQLKVRHKAGEHTFVSGQAGGNENAGIRPLYEMNPSALTATVNEIREVERRVQETYYVDMFLMMAQSDRREITAREIDERHEEKLLELGPVIERLHKENLEPAITRTYNIMTRLSEREWRMGRPGLLPEPPRELEETPLRIQFVSLLAQAQRAVAVGGIERVLGVVGNMAGVFPSILDKLDADQALDELSEALGTPPGVVLADDKVAKIRADKQAAEQGAAAAQMGAQGADVARVLSETEVTDTNMLGQILGGVGAA